MKILLLSILFLPAIVQAGIICKDYEGVKGSAMKWEESDFNERSASESMAALQVAVTENGAIGTCHLPNALALVEGYILKQQAQTALSSEGISEIIKQYNVTGFCEFIKLSKPCE